MKTLDEVIKAWSICFSDNGRNDCMGCPYADEDGEAACFNHDRTDAMHYLKEYREYLSEEKKKIKQAYEQGYTQAKHDDEVSRRWDESYRQSQMPWNKGYCEMGG